jgi:glycosyltransferase involved in cell wall biosynthesis
MSLVRTLTRSVDELVFASAAERGTFSADFESESVRTERIHLNDDRFDAFVTALAPDVVIFDRFMTEEQYGWRVERSCPDAARVLDTVDLHCLRDARRNAVDVGEDPLNVETLDLGGDLALREIAAVLRCDLSLVMSRFELRLLRERFGIDPGLLARVPFLFDEREQRGDTRPFAERTGFATIGNFRHPPNLDAVVWMRERVWPLIRRVQPGAELRVYGAYPPKKAVQLDDRATGFRIEGRADDAIETLGEARVCLAPLRYGAGLKGKLADAMIAGTPSVTTRVGAESMYASGRWCGAVADTPEQIAEAAALLHEEETAWTLARDRGFEIVREEFDAAREGSLFLERLRECGERLTETRRSNFVGSMLRHHRHRSAEYMSRWIEAKTKLENAG